MPRSTRPSKKAKFTKSRIAETNFALSGNNPARHIKFSGYGFPDSLTTNLIYSDSIILQPSVGTPCPSYTYRLNSVYDPDLTGIGGQPYWFDQLTAIYGRYMVMGAKIQVTYAYDNETAVGVGPTICGIECGDQSSLSSTNGAVLRMTGNVASDILTTQSEPKTVVGTYSPKQAYGSTLLDGIEAATSANPGRTWNAVVFAAPQGVDLTRPINAFVTIEYRVKFTQQIQNAGS